MSPPLNPPPATDSGLGQLPAYLSNGLMGLRVRDLPLRPPASLGRVWLSDAPQCARFERQEYDFGCGELRSYFTFAAGGAQARVEVLTFCSRTQPTLALQEIQVEVDRACDRVLRGIVDATGVHGRWLRRQTGTPGEDHAVVDGALRWETLGGLPRAGWRT